jgi:beta-xylosidase
MPKYFNKHVKSFSQRTGSFLLALGASTLFSTASFGANPFITSIYTADPSAHVWADGRLYVYPSRDIDPPRGCDLMDHYHVFSTDNMVDWRDEGEIVNASEVPWGRSDGGFMWAPDCAYKDGTYYYYFPHPTGNGQAWNNTWKIGVATSKKPASDFKVGGYIQGLPSNAMIDPAVFIDTDGTPYLYFGGGGHCMGGKLKDNMIEMASPAQDMTGLENFHEATWVFKRNGIYYLTYADNHPRHNEMRYATSTNALGPWTYKGVYLTGTDCDTTHGSVVEYKGQWYQFYHNCSISGQGTLRSICVDKVNFNDDGTIQMIVQTKTGVPSVGPAPAPNPNMVKYEAEDASVVTNGATIEGDSAASGGKSIQNLNLAGSYLQFNNVDGGENGSRATIDIYYAAAGRSKLRLSVNDVDYSYVNTLSTGELTNYTGHAYLTVPLNSGKANTIKLTGGHGGVNVDYITVSPLP